MLFVHIVLGLPRPLLPFILFLFMHGLGRRNEKGERLIQFCQENKLIIANTGFQQPVRKLYIWKSPGDISRNQIDYIVFDERFRDCIKQAKTYPGPDMSSDHNPVVVKINMKLKRTNSTKRSEQLELNLLKEETYKNKYNVEVQNIYERLCIEETEQQPDNGSFNNQCDKKWTIVKQSIKSSLNAVLPRKANRKKQKQKWMTDHILNLMENRKQFKNSDKDEYNRLSKQINLACKKAKEKWLVNQCEEVEQLEKQYKSREMHNKVKGLTLYLYSLKLRIILVVIKARSAYPLKQVVVVIRHGGGKGARKPYPSSGRCLG